MVSGLKIMDDREYDKKYSVLIILKSIQEYSKTEKSLPTSVYPISLPEDFLLQTLRINGPKKSDELIHHIFKLGLNIWSERLYYETFGSTDSLQEFINMVKKEDKF